MNHRALTVSRIAFQLDVSTRTARRIIEVGDLKAHRIGRQWRVFEPDLDEYLAKRSNQVRCADSKLGSHSNVGQT